MLFIGIINSERARCIIKACAQVTGICCCCFAFIGAVHEAGRKTTQVRRPVLDHVVFTAIEITRVYNRQLIADGVLAIRIDENCRQLERGVPSAENHCTEAALQADTTIAATESAAARIWRSRRLKLEPCLQTATEIFRAANADQG